MWWLMAMGALVGCQDAALQQVQAWTHISATVTPRAEAPEPAAAPEVVAAPEAEAEAAPSAPADYNPVSLPQGPRDTPGYSMPGVGKRASPTGEMVLPR